MPQTVKQRRALGWLALAAVVSIAWLGRPFAAGVLLGTLVAFTLEPLYEYLVRRTARPLFASLSIVLSTAVLSIGALVGFVSLFIERAVQLTNNVRQGLQPGGTLVGWVETASGWLSRFGVSTGNVASRLEAGAGEIASSIAGMAGAFAAGTFSVLLALFFAMLSMYLVLRHWSRCVATLEIVSPLKREYTRHLLMEFRRVGRMTVSGTFITGLAQGALATVGFWITGVPQPVFFGITTALASLIPAVGTLLVWIPAGLYLFATGHLAKGIVELCWGAFVVVGFSDYVIRPQLVGDEAMPTLLVFVALFGGVEAVGLPGLIVGPVVMALAVAILRLYAREESTGATA